MRLKYMAESGIIEEGDFSLREGTVPGSVTLCMNGRIPYGQLPLGSKRSVTPVYESNDAGGYTTTLFKELMQYDKNPGEEEALIVRLILALRITGEYADALQRAVKHLRHNLNDIYSALNRDSYKYTVYKELVGIVTHRNVVMHAENVYIKEALTMHMDESLIDNLYRRIKDNALTTIESSVYMNVKALASFSSVK